MSGSSVNEILHKRRQHVGPNVTLSYAEPLCMVRGQGAYLFDQDGKAYLDCVNNVAHVGHSNPEVTAAVCSQMVQLNTNSRYLSKGLTDYTAELAATLPHPLEVVYLVNSGSEANDLALRMARVLNLKAQHVVVLSGAYHGHLSSLIPLSPYKFWGSGGGGKADWVHVIPCPDVYRGKNLDGAAAARIALAAAAAAGGQVGMFICEAIPSCGGQVDLPPGYLAGVYREMRAAGVLCVADEVQTGFGRVGERFWAFETQGVVPDVVTLGKPIGNGFPLGACVVRKSVAAAFANGMEYFNTYGGCNAATAAGMAVLRQIKELQLQQNAADVGRYVVSGLRQLQQEFPQVIGHVRGKGLFLGVEIVTDPATKAPAPRIARAIKEGAKARQVLLSCDGPWDNVIKIKPPLVFGIAEAEVMLGVLRQVLLEVTSAAQASILLTLEQQHCQDVLKHRMALYEANEALYGSITSTAPQPNDHEQLQGQVAARRPMVAGSDAAGNGSISIGSKEVAGGSGAGRGSVQLGKVAAAGSKLEDMELGECSPVRSSSSSSGESGEEGLGLLLTEKWLE